MLIRYWFCFLSAWLLFYPFTTLAYSPPLGIPDPVWDQGLHPIDSLAPAWPDNWPGLEVPNYFYIDNRHPNATDENNPFGYPDKPRLSFSQRNFSAGSYIELHGEHAFGRLRKVFNCTATQPCWLRGSAAKKPVLTGSLELEASYLFVEHLDFNGGSNGAITVMGANSHHVVIRHSSIQNRAYSSHSSGIGMSPFASGKVHDIIVYNNLFRELGDWQATDDLDFHGVSAGIVRDSNSELNNIWILENTFYHLSGNGVQLVAGNWVDSEDYLHHVYIGKNTAHDNRQAGFWSKQASHVILSENISYGSREHGLQPGDGMGFQYGPDNIWFIFNTIYASNSGIRQSDTSFDRYSDHTAYIIGNLIYDIHPQAGPYYSLPIKPTRTGQAINLWHGIMTRYVLHNTIYDVHGGINLIQRGPVFIQGNIIKNVNSDDAHVSIYNAYDVVQMENNIFDNNSVEKTKIIWRSTSYFSLAAFIEGIGLCADCIETDPKFVNAGTNNFQLEQDSPAIDKESSLLHEILKKFEILYGINIEKDIQNNPRFANTISDIGAIEYQTQEEVPRRRPSPPTNLRAR